jgi:hypothetical protein
VKDGKSCVVRAIECPPQEGEEIVITDCAELTLDRLPARPPGTGEWLDIGVPPGLARWSRIRFPPNQTRGNHHTDTIDCHTVVEGAIELLLDDGAHKLMPGDSAMVTGVDHGWRTGPEGCAVSILIFGTPPRA